MAAKETGMQVQGNTITRTLVCCGSHFSPRATKDSFRLENEETMHCCCSSVSWMSCAVLSCFSSLPPGFPLFSSFLLLLPTLLFLDLFCRCLQPPKREPSATVCRRWCRHAVAIGLELPFLQLIARNGHEGVHVHLLSTSHHPSVTHTRVRMWMHAVVMHTQVAHVHDTCTLHMHLCIYVFI